jgi:hypothetical protein
MQVSVLTDKFIDASHPVSGIRLATVLESFSTLNMVSMAVSSSPPLRRSSSDLIEKLTHFSTPTLAHLLALIINQSPSHPDPKTSLIIIDSFSTLISSAFPRTIDSTPRKPGGNQLGPCSLYNVSI